MSTQDDESKKLTEEMQTAVLDTLRSEPKFILVFKLDYTINPLPFRIFEQAVMDSKIMQREYARFKTLEEALHFMSTQGNFKPILLAVSQESIE